MYIIKRTVNKESGKLAYLKYDGWHLFSNEPLDLTDVIRFTKHEAQVIELSPNEEFQWYGCYPELR